MNLVFVQVCLYYIILSYFKTPLNKYHDDVSLLDTDKSTGLLCYTCTNRSAAFRNKQDIPLLVQAPSCLQGILALDATNAWFPICSVRSEQGYLALKRHALLCVIIPHTYFSRRILRQRTSGVYSCPYRPTFPFPSDSSRCFYAVTFPLHPLIPVSLKS